MKETYTHGHQEPVLRSHRWRTAANSAAYLLPHLAPGLDLLDVGCGPGTITAELADLVAPGTTVGVDREQAVIDEARRTSTGPADFRTGDVYQLDFRPESFDVVHAHQVLQHLADPVAAIHQMGRVLRPGGRLAVRDADYGAFLWHPDDSRLDRWLRIYQQVCARNGGHADAGRLIPGWVADAGFEDLAVTSSNWTFADAGSRSWWAGLWAERTLGTAFGRQALDYGLATKRDWRMWRPAGRMGSAGRRPVRSGERGGVGHQSSSPASWRDPV